MTPSISEMGTSSQQTSCRQPRRRARTCGELPGLNRRASCELSVTVTVLLRVGRGCGRPKSDGVLVTWSWCIDDCMFLFLLPACRCVFFLGFFPFFVVFSTSHPCVVVSQFTSPGFLCVFDLDEFVEVVFPSFLGCSSACARPGFHIASFFCPHAVELTLWNCHLAPVSSTVVISHHEPLAAALAHNSWRKCVIR